MPQTHTPDFNTRLLSIVAMAVPVFCLGLAYFFVPSPAHATTNETAPSASEEAPIYCLDPVHTRVMLAVEHAGFSKAIGTISGSAGELRFDADDWTQAKIDVSVPIARLDFGDEKWNKAVLAGNLLDAARYPNARFVSDRIEVIGENRATVHGTLYLHGSEQPIALEVAMNAMKRHPLPPFRRTVGFSAHASLSRKAFGIDAWPSVIGDEVELRIETEAIRGRCDDKTPEAKSEPKPQSITEPTPNDDATIRSEPAS
jgi:polyisoprenoid-binding protein YceI